LLLLQQRAFATQSSSSSFFTSTARSSSIYSFFQNIESNYGNLSSLFDKHLKNYCKQFIKPAAPGMGP
jgi:hypothetical protein